MLVVDDDPAIRLICSTWLSLDGYEVLEAADGQHALELALTEEPAVVLLDLSMPVLDGFGVAAAMRADERTRERPARRPHGGDRRRTSSNACTSSAWPGFSSKPFDPGAVAEFVRDVIDELAAAKGHAPAGGHAF